MGAHGPRVDVHCNDKPFVCLQTAKPGRQEIKCYDPRTSEEG